MEAQRSHPMRYRTSRLPAQFRRYAESPPPATPLTSLGTHIPYHSHQHIKMDSQDVPKKIKNAIVTNVQNEEYVTYALLLAFTIQKYNPRLAELSTELVLLLPRKHEVTPDSLVLLEQSGWRIREEEDIAVNGTEKLNVNWRRNFIKLRVWAWTEYRKVVMLDADTMVLGDLSLLLSDGFGEFPLIFSLVHRF
jgi:alpha-N-acetylglucosamine transferase